jgi:hypothetical protein
MGSIGVLASRQIDALRLRYDFESVNRTVSFAYSVLNLSEESFQSLSLSDFKELFDLKENFKVQFRDYLTCSEEYGIEFLVFEAKRFRSELLNVGTLHLIYSNGEYVICKIK